MSDDTPNIVQRIRDALRGVTKGGWLVRGDAIMSPRVLVAVANSEPTVGEWRNNAALIAAAPGLLRDALARIEADAATIAALEAEVRERNAALADVWCYAGNGGERPAPAQVADAVHEMWRYKLSLENGLPDDYDDDAR